MFRCSCFWYGRSGTWEWEKETAEGWGRRTGKKRPPKVHLRSARVGTAPVKGTSVWLSAKICVVLLTLLIEWMKSERFVYFN